MKVGLVLVGAGSGRRLRSGEPKAFVDLAGKTLIQRSFEALQREPRFTAVAVVVPADRIEQTTRILSPVARPGLELRAVPGGAERQDSVRKGVRALPVSCQLVVVHDCARPFVEPAVIAACIDAAAEHGAATVAVPATDTIKEVDERGAVVRTLDRARLRLVQTPQAFRTEILLRAHERAQEEGVTATDDAALVEWQGGVVWTVPGSPENVKITTPADLDWARWRLRAEPR